VPDDSPELRKQIEAALKLDKLKVGPRYPRAIGVNVELDLKSPPVPVPLAYDVFLRGPSREWKLATITATGATHYGTGRSINDKDHFDAKRVGYHLPSFARSGGATASASRACGAARSRSMARR
jgi:hypothetical protein